MKASTIFFQFYFSVSQQCLFWEQKLITYDGTTWATYFIYTSFYPLVRNLVDHQLTRPFIQSCTKENILTCKPHICSGSPRYIPKPSFDEMPKTPFIFLFFFLNHFISKHKWRFYCIQALFWSLSVSIQNVYYLYALANSCLTEKMMQSTNKIWNTLGLTLAIRSYKICLFFRSSWKGDKFLSAQNKKERR